MRPLFLFLLALFFSSCTINKITERRTTKKVNLVHEVLPEILALRENHFSVDALKNKTLKRKLKQLHAENVLVFREANSEFEGDSIIMFLKYQFFLSKGQIIFDFKKQPRTEIKPKWGGELIRIDDRVYFRKHALAIS